MSLEDMGRYNFHMGVEHMKSFGDDADPKDVVEALRVLSELFKWNELGDSVDPFGKILASKAIDVAYAALAYPLCTDDGLDVKDCAQELKHELHYWV